MTEKLETVLTLNTKDIQRGTKEFARFRDQVTGVVTKLQTSINKLNQNVNQLNKSLSKGKGAAQMAKGQQQLASASNNASKATVSQSQAIKQANSQFQEFQKTVQNTKFVPDRVSTDSINQARQKLIQYELAVEKSGASSENAVKRQQAYNNTLKAQSERVSTVSKSVSAYNTRVQQAANAIKQSNLSDERKQKLLTNLQSAQERYNRSLNRKKTNTTQVTAAENQLNNVLNYSKEQYKKVTDQTKKTGKETDVFRSTVEDLNKSTILALGPLSGIASRISALTGLFKQNAPAIAATVAALTGYTVGLREIIRVSAQFEQQNLRVQAVLKSVGDQASVTAEQLEEISVGLASDTLTGLTEARDAATFLATIGGQTADEFERVLFAAQGLSRLSEGNLQSNVRKLGRVLEDPLSNLGALGEAGIQFNDEQEKSIKLLRSVGKVGEANNIIFEKLAPFIELARSEGQSLNGIIDTIGVNFQRFIERVTTSIGTADRLEKAYKAVDDTVKELLGSQQAVNSVANAFAGTIETISVSVKFLADNFQLIAGTVVALVSALFGGAVIRLLGFMLKTLKPIGTILKTAVKSVQNLTKGLKASTAQGLTFRGVMFNILQAAVSLGSLITGANIAFSNMEPPSALNKSLETAKSIQTTLDSISTSSFDIDTSELENAQLFLTEANRRMGELQDKGDELPSHFQGFEDIAESIAEDWEDILGFATEFFVLDPLKAAGDLARRGAGLLGDAESAMFDPTGLSQAYGAVAGDIQEVAKEVGSAVATGLGFDVIVQGYQDAGKAREEYVTTVQKEEKVLSAAEGAAKAALQRLDDQRESLKQARTGAEEMAKAIKDLTSTYRPSIDESKQLSEDLGIVNEQLRRVSQNPAIDRLLSEQLGEDASKALQRLRDSIIKAREEAEKDTKVSFITKLKEDIEDARAAIDDAFLGTSREVEVTVATRQVNQLDSDEFSSARSQLGLGSGASRQDAVDALVRQRQLLNDLTRAEEILAEAQKNRGTEAEQVLRTLEEQRNALQTAGKDSGFALDFVQGEAFSGLSEAFEEQLNELLESDATFRDKLNQADTKESYINDLLNRYEEEIELTEEQEAKLAEIRKAFDMEVRNQQAETMDALFSSASSITDNISEVFKNAKSENNDFAKAVAITGVIISAAQAMMAAKANANQEGLTVSQSAALFAAEAATITALAGSQIATITSAREGGLIRGQGTSTSDSIPAQLSDKEFVMQASAVKRFGTPFMNMINRGEVPAFAGGGSMDYKPLMGNSSESSSGSVSLNVEIVNQGRPVEETGREEFIDENGERKVRILIRDTVKDMFGRGEMDKTMKSNFEGIRRRPELR